MIELSEEQLAIVNAPIEPLSVMACAGSGKTHTTVHRLVEIRRQMKGNHGRPALLSFSNIAVDTFKDNYQLLIQNTDTVANKTRVEIDTLDGFITRNVLHPHAYRSMRSSQVAFLVTGEESFLNGFKIYSLDYPISIAEVQVGIRDFTIYFYYSKNDNVIELDYTSTLVAINKLGKVGAYTHNLGRYWCYRTLQEYPRILKALVHRYPNIIIDEAQDIGVLHKAIINQLIDAGSKISLIGDSSQSIYGFAGADGKFLPEYGIRPEVITLGLTKNYRSLPPIVDLANKLASRRDIPHRKQLEPRKCIFFVPYEKNELEKLIEAFQAKVLLDGLKVKRSAVLFRNAEHIKKLLGTNLSLGQGIVKRFASATLDRDKEQNYLKAFNTVIKCIIDLLDKPPKNLLIQLLSSNTPSEIKKLKSAIWKFTRNPDTGLPSAKLIANELWHSQLLVNVKKILTDIEGAYGFQRKENLGLKLSKKDLPKTPLMISENTKDLTISQIRIDTVHQSKGESLDAILYVASKQNISALLNGVDTEAGRIGYVAITRARDLIWLAIPSNSLSDLKMQLIDYGFEEFNISS